MGKAEAFIIHFFVTSLAVSAGLLAILGVKWLLKKHISARWQYNLDFFFLVVLMVPFIPGRIFKSLDFKNVFSRFQPGETVNAGFAAGKEQIAAGAGWLQDVSVSVERITPAYLPLILWGIWLAGMIVFVAAAWLCNRSLRLVKESAMPMEDAEVLSLINECKGKLSMKRRIWYGTSILVKSPAAFGIFNTRVVLPAGKVSASSMRYFLLHELVHCKNLDIPVNRLLCLLQGLYWFHPLVYFAFKEMRADREISCDTAVLKLLPEACRLDYGETLLNLAGAVYGSAPFSAAADLAGAQPQIFRRVKRIAAYTAESKWLKIKSVCIFMLLGIMTASWIPSAAALAAYDGSVYRFKAEWVVYEDLSRYFDGYEGSFVLFDLDSGLYTIHNKERSVMRVSPDSTYKIYSALIALEEDVMDMSYTYREWDGIKYPYESWNRDQTLRTALQNSVNWYFQEIDSQVGAPVLDTYFTQLSYGNHDLSGGIDSFWMESSLKISPVEQVELLTDLYRNNTMFKTEQVRMLKDSLRLSEKNGAVLSGKTGTGSVNGKVTNGWFIGYVEKWGKTAVFAANISGTDGAGGSTAVQITMDILKDKGIY